MKLIHIAAILLMASGLARGDTIDVLGQQLNFSNPSGYCTLGKTQRERDLIAKGQRTVGPSSRIVHAAVRCSELEAFKKGTRDELDHWLQIQLIGPKGNFKRVEVGRETFLASIANASPRINTTELDRRVRAAFTDTGMSMTKMQVIPLGRDGNAAYFSSRASLNTGNDSRTITGLSGMTLVNSLPLTINVYEGTGMTKSRDNLQLTLQQLLLSVLTEN